MRKCQICKRQLPLGCSHYTLRIAVTQGFDGIIEPPAEDLKALLKQARDKTEGVPESLLEEEIHREFSFVLCPRCKEKFCANPLNQPLDSKQIPKTVSDLEES